MPENNWKCVVNRKRKYTALESKVSHDDAKRFRERQIKAFQRILNREEWSSGSSTSSSSSSTEVWPIDDWDIVYTSSFIKFVFSSIIVSLVNSVTFSWCIEWGTTSLKAGISLSCSISSILCQQLTIVVCLTLPQPLPIYDYNHKHLSFCKTQSWIFLIFLVRSVIYLVY